MKKEILCAKDILLSSEMSIKAVSVIKKLVALEDEERILLQNGSLRDLIEKNTEKREHYEFEKKELSLHDRIKQELSYRCSSNKIKFSNLSNVNSITNEIAS